MTEDATPREPAKPLVYPEHLNDELVLILGKPNFVCGPYAHLFRAAGSVVPRKAEAEQAFVLHWLLKLYLRHGDKWAEFAQKDVELAQEEVERRKVRGQC